MTDFDRTYLSRRDLLLKGASGAAALALGGRSLAQGVAVRVPGTYGPFAVGFQSYSLRGYGVDEALERTEKFGIEYWEAFQAHMPLTDSPAKISEMLAKLKSHHISMPNWGVEGFDGNAAKARKVFDFAKTMGIRVITADPSPEAFPVLDKLLDEYKVHGIHIAIHNHGPGARYDKISSVEKAIKGHHDRIGACVDTGHYLRSGEDPVEAVRVFGKRVYSVHMKDVKNKTEFTILGKGDLRTADLLYELRKLKYGGLVALEYEEKPENPIIDIDQCLAALKDAVDKVKARKV